MTNEKSPYPSDEADKFVVRFPPGSSMRDELKAAAKKNGRTTNAEIIARLQASFEPTARWASGAGPERLIAREAVAGAMAEVPAEILEALVDAIAIRLAARGVGK